jgi:hypothetical protein
MPNQNRALESRVIEIPEIGSRWQECDRRFEGRTVEVVFGFDVVEQKVRIKNTATGRITWAKVARFNGKNGGYVRLVEAK